MVLGVSWGEYFETFQLSEPSITQGEVYTSYNNHAMSFGPIAYYSYPRTTFESVLVLYVN